MKHMKSQRCICDAKIRNKTCNIDRMTHYMKLKNIYKNDKRQIASTADKAS